MNSITTNFSTKKWSTAREISRLCLDGLALVGWLALLVGFIGIFWAQRPWLDWLIFRLQ